MSTGTDVTEATAGTAAADDTGADAALQPLSVKVHVFERPWSPTTLSESEFDELLLSLGRETAARIQRRHAAGVDGYTRDSFAIAIMSPIAGPWDDNEDALMAVIVIGEDGERFIPNALAKAYEGRRLFYVTGSANPGDAVYTRSHLLPDTAFRYGHSTLNNGGSGQSESVDMREAGRYYKRLTDEVDAARERWEQQVGSGRWFTDDDQPEEDGGYVLPAWCALATLGDD